MFAALYIIVCSRVGTPFFSEGTPPPPAFPFCKPFLSEANLKSYVSLSCKKHFKMNVLLFALYYVSQEHH